MKSPGRAQTFPERRGVDARSHKTYLGQQVGADGLTCGGGKN